MGGQAPVRMGVLGCGGFGRFATRCFLEADGVELVGIAGTDPAAAARAREELGAEDLGDAEALLGRDEVDLVYIATPPFLHHPQARDALRAGKHVIVEKPLAMDLAQADELIDLARRGDRLLIANLMQPMNPLVDSVRELVSGRLLGPVLRGWFENYATDEWLPPEHWFWDPGKSGGIFVEHGVHFFDLFARWLGEGRVLAAAAVTRAGTRQEDEVHCTVRYPGGALVDFYHGFHQPARLDRQELRLLFARGDLTLEEWVPVRARLRALVDDALEERLRSLFPGASVQVLAAWEGEERRCRGRGSEVVADRWIELRVGEGEEKMTRYAELLTLQMADQVAWLRDRTHRRRVTEEHGRASLATACEARQRAAEA